MPPFQMFNELIITSNHGLILNIKLEKEINMIEHLDLVGNWYEVAQYICIGIIAFGIVTVIYDGIRVRIHSKIN